MATGSGDNQDTGPIIVACYSFFGKNSDPQAWQIRAQDRQAWRQWSDMVMTKLGHYEFGYYRRPEQVDLEGRCMVQRQLGFHLLPARIPPVEDPYPSSYVDVRAPPLQKLKTQWTISVQSQFSAEEGLSIAMLIQLPHKPH